MSCPGFISPLQIDKNLFMEFFPFIILLLVFSLIAVRQVGRFRLDIWQIMLLGAFSVLLAGSISPKNALGAVNLDVMLFLFGMFVVGEALVESGYLYHLAHGAFKGARSTDGLVLFVLFVMGGLSAFLMNDTIAIIGTPLMLFYAKKHKVSHKLLLLALCFAVTMGSVLSPIGNPQNLLIAIGGNIVNPFVTFLKYLAVPTVVNLFIAYLVLKYFYGEHFHRNPLDNSKDEITDAALAGLSKVSLAIIVLMVAFKISAAFFFKPLDFRLTYIALFAALPIIILSPKRKKILLNIDWHTLIFFAALFVLMESVWESGVIQSFINGAGLDAASAGLVLFLSVTVSQLLSNVPFVALYLPVLNHIGSTDAGMMALAAGSTIAGNLLILGAASNVIVIQNAEKNGATITFLEFAKAGVPLTVLNVIVYWAYFWVMGG